MSRDTDNLENVQWVAQCAHRLREQWPHADPTSLEEAAGELWRDKTLRAMRASEAAAMWLAQGLPLSQ